MKRHRVIISFFSFLILTLIGIVCSNMQSQLATRSCRHGG